MLRASDSGSAPFFAKQTFSFVLPFAQWQRDNPKRRRQTGWTGKLSIRPRAPSTERYRCGCFRLFAIRDNKRIRTAFTPNSSSSRARTRASPKNSWSYPVDISINYPSINWRIALLRLISRRRIEGVARSSWRQQSLFIKHSRNARNDHETSTVPKKVKTRKYCK